MHVGGASDPHLDEVCRAAVALGRDHRLLRVDAQREQRVRFTLAGDLWVDGESVSPTGYFSATMLRLAGTHGLPCPSVRRRGGWPRWDGRAPGPVYGSTTGGPLGSTYQADHVAPRPCSGAPGAPHRVSNDVSQLAVDASRVAKPVAGGGHW